MLLVPEGVDDHYEVLALPSDVVHAPIVMAHSPSKPLGNLALMHCVHSWHSLIWHEQEPFSSTTDGGQSDAKLTCAWLTTL